MKKTGILLLLLLSFESCSLVGIHLKVENPSRAGKYPKETKQMLLLGAKSSFRDCYDVYHNSLNIKIEPAKKWLSGTVVISAKALRSIDTFQIDLYKNMQINQILVNNKPVNYYRVEGAVFIIPEKPIDFNQQFTTSISYEGKPIVAKKPPWNGGFTWKKDKHRVDWDGVSCESEGSSLWWPSKDEMADEADSTDATFTVPSGLMAVSNGLLKDSIHNADGTNSFHWHVSYPINNYNVTVYVGEFKLLPDVYESPVTGKQTALNHYVLPWNYDLAKAHFQQVKKHLAFYEKMFGEYPWQRDGFKFVESPFEGMEHQTAIAYGNGYKNDFDYFDYIILHETAHEWWGNSVTAADLADGWIHEGFASYCEALFVESVMGHQAYLNYMYWQRMTIENKRPVVRKRNIRYFDYHDEDIYTKGSWVLHTLRTTISDDSLFFSILKTFRLENHEKQVYSESFIALVNKMTGKDYNWFFQQYLFRREAPILEFCWKGTDFYFRWTSVNDDFRLPVRIRVKGKSIELHPTTTVQKMSIPTDDTSFYDNSDEQYYGTSKNDKLPKLFKDIPSFGK